MRHIHGISDAKKVGMIESDEAVAVTVRDGDGVVHLFLAGSGFSGFGAVLTPEQARHVSGILAIAADRVVVMCEE